jgi:hypothetical protein
LQLISGFENKDAGANVQVNKRRKFNFYFPPNLAGNGGCVHQEKIGKCNKCRKTQTLSPKGRTAPQ